MWELNKSYFLACTLYFPSRLSDSADAVAPGISTQRVMFTHTRALHSRSPIHTGFSEIFAFSLREKNAEKLYLYVPTHGRACYAGLGEERGIPARFLPRKLRIN